MIHFDTTVTYFAATTSYGNKFKIFRFCELPVNCWFRMNKKWFRKTGEFSSVAEQGFNLSILIPDIFVGVSTKYFADPYC